MLAEPAPPEPTPETVEGKTAQKLAEEIVAAAGFTITQPNQRIPKTGTRVGIVAADADGAPWFFDVTGAFTTYRGGLIRTETVWKALGRAHALRGRIPHDTPVVFLTTDLPRRTKRRRHRVAPPGPTRSSTRSSCVPTTAGPDSSGTRRAATRRDRSPASGAKPTSRASALRSSARCS